MFYVIRSIWSGEGSRKEFEKCEHTFHDKLKKGDNSMCTDPQKIAALLLFSTSYRSQSVR